MIKANIVLDKKIWEKKLKKPEIYFKKKLNKLSKLSIFKNKNQEFTVMLTNNKKMKDLNSKFRNKNCLLYTSPSPRDQLTSRMPSSA